MTTTVATPGSSCFGAETADAFLQPFRSAHLSASEVGIVSDILIREGDVVIEGQPLVHLDSEVQRVTMEVAEAQKVARGQLESAQARAELRRLRYEAIQRLRQNGNATAEELSRAEVELQIAKGDLTTAQEQKRIRDLESDRFRIELERRTLRAPFPGVVTNVLKEPGELAGISDPELLELVQLNPLRAEFDLPLKSANRLTRGQVMQLRLPETGTTMTASVEYIAPIISAETGTVVVRVQADNPGNAIKSGMRCVMDLSGKQGSFDKKDKSQ